MTLFICIAVAFFLLIGFMGNKKSKEERERMKSQGVDSENLIYTGKYTGGHPEIDEPSPSFLAREGDKINIYFGMVTPNGNILTGRPTLKGSLPMEGIKNILVEDKSTVSRRITAGRLLLVGVFALAWRKKQKDNSVYLIIEWNDGRFDHETLFEFDNKMAMQTANTARNKLIRMAR